MSEINDRIKYSEEMRLDSDNTLRVTDFVTPPTEVLRLSREGITANPDIPVLTADEFIMAVVNAAAEWERRACAKVVETHPGDKESLLQAAAKIRNRT